MHTFQNFELKSVPLFDVLIGLIYNNNKSKINKSQSLAKIHLKPKFKKCYQFFA